ncbi:pyridoxal phosphate-dependent transferase [Aspergillus aurantiobrunneus]
MIYEAHPGAWSLHPSINRLDWMYKSPIETQASIMPCCSTHAPAQRAKDHLLSAQQRYEARNPKSKVQHHRATSYLPGGNTRSVLHATPFPLCMASGQGNRLVDLDGHVYLDYLGDMTAGLYGHSHPVILETVTSTLTNIGPNLGGTTTAEARFAEAICDRFSSVNQTRFCNSGTEANLYALSVARQATARSKAIVFEGAYHGGVLSFACGVDSNNIDKDDWILGRYNDAKGAVRLIVENKDVAAAVLVEPMQGAGGRIPGTAEILHAIQDAAKENGVIFILDEVVTSRLAPGGLQSIVVHPDRGIPLSSDLTTLGKWIGGGLSISVFGGRRDLMSVYDPRTSSVHHSGTFNNNTLAMNVGCKAMTSVYTADSCAALNALGDELRQGLQELATGTKMAITGIGAVKNIHFLPNGEKNGISTVRDLEVEPGSRGFWTARRGMLSLVLGTGRQEVEQLLDAVKDFLEESRDLIAVQ